MYEIEFKVNDEGFEEELIEIHNRFSKMVQTMVDVHHIIEAEMNARSLVPLDTGRLETSFYHQIYDQSPNSITLHSVFDAVDPKYGFHYAYYQHELIRGGFGAYSRYTRSKEIGHTSKSNHHRHGYRGTDHYLLKGVQGAESLIWRVIEQDYMSLFTGGI